MEKLPASEIIDLKLIGSSAQFPKEVESAFRIVEDIFLGAGRLDKLVFHHGISGSNGLQDWYW